MEKTIYIDNQAVRLKSTAATPMRYKAQFRKDYFSELMKLSKMFRGSLSDDVTSFDLDNISFDDLDHLDFEVFFNFIWVLAKTADKSISEPMEWLDGFDAMPIAEVFPQVTDLLKASIESQKK